MNLENVFKDLTLKQAWDGDYDLDMHGMPPEQQALLLNICEMRPKLRDVYDFLAEPDSLFCNIYREGTPVGETKCFFYPFNENDLIPEGVKEVCGPVGTQTSIWHLEDLRQHAQLVATNLIDAGLDAKLSITLALLHDVGKKYTAATNKYGGVSFHNHAFVSAFIASHWLRDEPKRVAKAIVAVIYAHMLAKDEWIPTEYRKNHEPANHRESFREELIEFLNGDVWWANQTMELIDTFSICDEGVEKFTVDIVKNIDRGKDNILLFA